MEIVKETQSPRMAPEVAAAQSKQFNQFLTEVRAHFDKQMAEHGPYLYRTYNGALRKSPFNSTYLNSFDTPELRQHHNCACCRGWMRQMAGAVFIRADGTAVSAFWDPAVITDPVYRPAVEAMKKLAESTPVSTVFAHSEEIVGFEESGGFNHFFSKLPPSIVFEDWKLGKQINELNNDYTGLKDSLRDYSPEVTKVAASLLASADAFKSEQNFADRAQFLVDAHEQVGAIKHTLHRDNLIRRLGVTAPAGWARPRSNILAIVLDALAEGKPAQVALKLFNLQLDPMRYRRTEEEAVKKGQIQAAEKLIERLGLASALARRPAKLVDVPSWLWQPKVEETAAEVDAKPASVFQKLLDKSKTRERVKTEVVHGTIDGGHITFQRLLETVLPRAVSTQVWIPGDNTPLNFRQYLTQVDPEAKHLWKWETEEKRQPLSAYMYLHGAPASIFNLEGGWHDVVGVIASPSELADYSYGGNRGATFVIAGACDQNIVNVPMFPQDLRNELQEIRGVIESHGHNSELVDPKSGEVAGLAVNEGHVTPIRVLVSDGVLKTSYIVDRFH